ncbi:MAG TPA: pyridoxamine 5'-phosphate oxidase family protein [Jiangellaceae bacterium]|nr:pyridoxamine 5'-phosphate oxidase family protein [Jiangellaceae bacterium]
MTRPQATKLDGRFSSPEAEPARWDDTERVLAEAELYWLTTVRADGRPHVTPLIGIWHDGAAHFCTGLDEQKARNLEHHTQVALTTGTNSWARGFDVVVEGSAERVTDRGYLQILADAYEAKYGSAWHFDVADGVFDGGDHPALVFRVEPVKVLAFAKEPHAMTTFRFAGSGATAR